MPRAIGYIRCSTHEQVDSGLGLDVQAERIRAYATLKGLDIDIITDAGVSGGKPLAKREGGQRLLAAIRERKADAVVFLKLDRGFRNAGDCLATVEPSGISKPPWRKFFITMNNGLQRYYPSCLWVKRRPLISREHCSRTRNLTRFSWGCLKY